MATQRHTKVKGRNLETEVVENLLTHSFWAMMVTSTVGGQPFDIIACKNGRGFAIECKELVSSEKFGQSRIEDNQRFAFQVWADCGNDEGWFAFKMDDGTIWMIQAKEVLSWDTPQTVRNHGLSLEDWLRLRK